MTCALDKSDARRLGMSHCRVRLAPVSLAVCIATAAAIVHAAGRMLVAEVTRSASPASGL
jgi:hypothetical protein